MDKYIGVLGGLGYRGTMLAYEKLNKRYQNKVGEGHTCPIRLLSIDFIEINELLPFRISEAADKLLPFLMDIDGQEVSCTIMINNTLHQALDLLKDELLMENPLGHIGLLLTEYLKERKARKVMLIGSAYTMSSGYFDAFVPDDVEIIKASTSIQEELETLRKTFYTTTDNTLSKQCYNRIMTRYTDIDVFIITCTEHSLAFSKWTDSARWVDTMDLQCNWAVERLLSTP